MSFRISNVVPLLAVLTLLTSCSQNPSRTYIEIRQALAAISQKALILSDTGGSLNLTNAIIDLVQTKGGDLFKCGSAKNHWMCISPEVNKWTNRTPTTNVAIYSEEIFFQLGVPRKYMLGIDFQGKPVKFIQRPKWQPLPFPPILANGIATAQGH